MALNDAVDWALELGGGVRVALIQAGTFRSRGSFGWDGAFGTHFWVDPKQQMVALFMVQRLPPPGRTMHSDFDDAVVQAIIE